MDTRYGKVKWGAGNPRSRTSAGNWKKPLKWNRDAEEALGKWRLNGADPAEAPERPRVFSLSLGDILDSEVPAAWLADALAVIYQTQSLDWLLLTKRPKLWRKRLTEAVAAMRNDADVSDEAASWVEAWLRGDAPKNVWMGVTVESQDYTWRIDELVKIPAKVRFLSMEPLLGSVDLGPWIGDHDCHACNKRFWGDDVRAKKGLVNVDYYDTGPETDALEKCPYCDYESTEEDATIGVVGDSDHEPTIHEPLLGPIDLRKWTGYNPVHEAKTKRVGLGPGDSGGCAGDRQLGIHLAGGAPGAQPVVGGDERSPDKPPTRGEREPNGLSPSPLIRCGTSGARAGAPVGVGRRGGSHPSRTDDQPQEREEGRQPAGEPRVGDIRRASAPRSGSPREEARPVGGSQPSRQVEGGRCPGDQTPEEGRGGVEIHRKGLRRERPDGVENRTRGKLAISWVIVGGESGAGARPMHVGWARSLMQQCQASEVPFHFKQHGAWAPCCAIDEEALGLYKSNKKAPNEWDQPTFDELYGSTCTVPNGVFGWDGVLMHITEDLCYHQDRDPMLMFRVGKKKAGRLLDGKEWNEVPA